MSYPLPKRWDSHHVFWTKTEYTTRIEKRFRNTPGLVIPTPLTNHNLLHRRLTPPPKPERQEMVNVMDYLDDTPAAVQFDRLWGIEKTARFFGAIASQDTEAGFKARRIESHLQDQMGYLSMRLVEIKIV